MLASKSIWLKVGLSSLAIGLLSFYLFLVREARNEIYFLCSNFFVGNSKRDVLRQLDTAELSDYRISETEAGAEIVLSSTLHFRLLQCSIETNASGEVISAQYE